MTDIEQAFAAAVANARGNARLANTAGIPQSVSDQVAAALCDLSMSGLSSRDGIDLVERYVWFDDQGDPWPRALPDNVVPMRR